MAQVPTSQKAFDAQSTSVEQLLSQAVPLQIPGAHGWLAAAGQLTLTPSQCAARIATPALQLAGPHVVPAFPGLGEQTPAEQASTVQGLPSEVQAVPSGETTQAPVVALHTPG